MQISARVEYGIRALLALGESGEPMVTEAIAEAQGLPAKYLGSVMNELRRVGLVTSRRGNEGGYRLARPASEITVADVVRILDGPLAEVRGMGPELVTYDGPAQNLSHVWVALRAAIRGVLERVTLDDVIHGRFPDSVTLLTEDPESWASHTPESLGDLLA